MSLMKVGIECLPCMVNQAKNIVELKKISKHEKIEILKEVLRFLEKNFDESKIPALLGSEMHRYLKKRLNDSDPLEEKKERSNTVAMELVRFAESIVNEEDDPKKRLKKSFKIALAGNLIDFSIYNAEVRRDLLLKAFNEPLAIDDFNIVYNYLKSSKNVLYICDNAGEIVFDKICIEEIKKLGLNVVACVKGNPILNDATLKDAEFAGLNKICKVITTGNDSVGIDFRRVSNEFLKEYKKADIIVAKGQGNYETLSEIRGKRIVFVLKAKCEPVARSLGVKRGENVIKFVF